jgi:hypothetical protein
MTTIVLDEQTLKRFSGIQGEAEVRDESGNLRGRFYPTTPPTRPYVPQFTEEELARAEAEPGGRSLKEILADLEARS